VDVATATKQAQAMVFGLVARQAATLSFIDLFWILAMFFLAMVPLLFFIYSGGVAATFGILALLYRHAWRCRAQLELNPVEALEARVDIYRNVAIASIGVLSILLAAILPSIASPRWLGLAGWVYAGIGLTEWRLGEYLSRERNRLQGAPQTLPL
jgi:hypothetical protein